MKTPWLDKHWKELCLWGLLLAALLFLAGKLIEVMI